jgi:fatty acid kinase fatty acid binding subunit
VTGPIRLCTDSSAQLPAPLVASLGLDVVPIVVSVDGVSYDETDLDVERFFERLAAGSQVTTSQPSPGRFGDVYAAAAGLGAEEVLSVHVDGRVSGTVGSAELAAREAPIPVMVVDSRTVSFGVGVCALAAADVLAGGASAGEAAAAIERLAPTIGNVFVAGATPGGRVPAGEGLAVLSFAEGRSETIGSADSLDEAAEIMALHVLSQGAPIGIAVGHAASSTARAADRLAAALSSRAEPVLRYRVGPSVGSHTGPLSFGAFWWGAAR